MGNLVSYSHIASGIIFLNKDTEYVDVPIQIRNSTSVTLRIRYREDQNDKTPRFSSKSTGDLIDFCIFNISSSFGSGTTKGIRLGTVGNDEIYMYMWSYRISTKDNPVWKVEYAVYLMNEGSKDE